jgi:hypothetical protein
VSGVSTSRHAKKNIFFQPGCAIRRAWRALRSSDCRRDRLTLAMALRSLRACPGSILQKPRMCRWQRHDEMTVGQSLREAFLTNYGIAVSRL